MIRDVRAYVEGLSPQAKADLDKMLLPELTALWLPDFRNRPQVAAYYSQADLLLYGGAAGSGKTSLLVGLAATCHYRTVIFADATGGTVRTAFCAALIGSLN